MSQYLLDHMDRRLIDRAIALLEGVVATRLSTAAQLVSIAKALHVLRHLPRSVDVGSISISVIGPRRRHGEIETYFWWDVNIDSGQIAVSSGGHFYRPSTGGDSFRSMIWSACPGESPALSDYRKQHSIVPGLRSFLTDIPTTEELAEGFELSVDDESNELLEEEGDEEAEQSDDAAEGADWVISPQDAVEQVLARQVKPAEVDAREPQFAYGVDDCGLCGIELSNRGLMVDGRLKGSLMWGNLCAHCFAAQGDGLGEGVGQLYARQPDGQWRLVAGFSS